MAGKTPSEMKPHELSEYLDDLSLFSYLKRQISIVAQDVTVQAATGAAAILETPFVGLAAPKDQRPSTQIEASLTRFIQEGRELLGQGQFDIYNGAGWKIPAGVKYNGEIVSEDLVGQTLPLGSLFIYDRHGNYEIVDKKHLQFYLDAGVYVLGQIGVAVATGAAKPLSAAGKLTEIGSGTLLGAKNVLGAELVGGTFRAGQDLTHAFILSKSELEKFSGLLSHTSSLDWADLSKRLNSLFYEYSANDGPQVGNYYIKSVSTPDETLKRLQEVSNSRIEGQVRDHPKDQPRLEDKIFTPDVRNHLAASPEFRRDYYNLAIQALSNHELTSVQQSLLRFGINVIMSEGLNLTGEDNKSTANQPVYSERQKLQTLDSLRYYYSGIISDFRNEESPGLNFRRENVTNDDIVEYLSEQYKLSDATAKAAQKNSEEMRKIQDAASVGAAPMW